MIKELLNIGTVMILWAVMLIVLSACTTTPPYNLAVNEITNTCYDHELTALENFGRECWE